jgi:hypothetical protein
MTEYFAVLDDNDRRGPFESMNEPVEILKKTSSDRGYTDAQAQNFFLHHSTSFSELGRTLWRTHISP